MKDQILVVGGYGRVGQEICKILVNRYSRNVIAAGRNLQKAVEHSKKYDGSVKALQLDISKPIPSGVLEQVKIAIMCLDQADVSFVQECLRQGVHYIDITANSSFIQKVEQLYPVASAQQAAAVLSVGLAPGLTNMLALGAIQSLDTVDSIDISIMLGLGDKHGEAAVAWTIDNLRTKFHITEHGKQRLVNSFTEGSDVDLGPIGIKRVYRFPFSDQITLPGTLKVPTVATKLGFHSKTATIILAALKKIGFFRVLDVEWIRKLFVKSMEKIHIGDNSFAIKATAAGHRYGLPAATSLLLTGKDQSAMTAAVAAYVADSLYTSINPGGIYHMEQIFSAHDILQLMEEVAHRMV